MPIRLTKDESSIFNFIYSFLFRDRGGKGEREEEKHQCKRATSVGYFPYLPRPGTEHTT